MGRLIDYDVLLKDFQNTITAQSDTFDWLNMISRQPTAFDVEKVVAELDKVSFHMEPRTEGHYADNGVFLDEAIKIVRKGGVE